MANPQGKEQEINMSIKEIMSKKVSELSQGDIHEMIVPLGTPGMGFPMVEVQTKDKRAENVLSVVESATNFLRVHSHLPREEVIGMLHRENVIPSMMTMMREMILRTAPNSKNRRMTIFGDAGSGKSHLFRMFGKILDPKGAIFVDCGGMNMRELFFRTVIDYGKGVKSQLEEKLTTGAVKESTVKIINDAFPDAIIAKGDGTYVMDWARIGERGHGEDGKKNEGYEEANARAVNALTRAYDNEGLNIQSNSFGIKTVEGILIQAFKEGRYVFLDEYNKSKGGSLDKFQNYLQLMKGEISYTRIENELATSDDDSPKYIELRAEDMRASHFLAIAGNDTSDGTTTQELSKSMMDRLDVKRIRQFTLQDWKCRISQYLTGMPISIDYEIHEDLAKKEPVKFAQWLLDKRFYGLTEEKRQNIPARHIAALKEFQKTLKAIDILANYNYVLQEVAREDSSIHDNAKIKAFLNDEVIDELSTGSEDVKMTPRKFSDILEAAASSVPTVREAGAATLAWDFTKAVADFDLKTVAEQQPGYYKMGKNLARSYLEQIANDTQGMPYTQSFLLEYAQDVGLFKNTHSESTNSGAVDYLEDLLKVDDLSEYGGFEFLSNMRSILMSYVKEKHKEQEFGAADDTVMPLDVLGGAFKAVHEKMLATEEKKAQQNEAESQKKPEDRIEFFDKIRDVFLIPNDDLDNLGKSPVAEAEVLYSYNISEDESPKLVDFKAALLAIALPQPKNTDKEKQVDVIEKLWPKDLMEAAISPDPQDQYFYDVVMGQSEYGLNMLILSVLNEQDEEDTMYVLDDKKLSKKMAVGSGPINSALYSMLKEKNIEYVDKTAEAAKESVDGFLRTGALARYDKQNGEGLGQTENEKYVFDGLSERMISALCLFCDDEEIKEFTTEKGNLIAKNMLLSDFLCSKNRLHPELYTAIVKKNTLKP